MEQDEPSSDHEQNVVETGTGDNGGTARRMVNLLKLYKLNQFVFFVSNNHHPRFSQQNDTDIQKNVVEQLQQHHDSSNGFVNNGTPFLIRTEIDKFIDDQPTSTHLSPSHSTTEHQIERATEEEIPPELEARLKKSLLKFMVDYIAFSDRLRDMSKTVEEATENI
jgi:hypothetical protein